MDIVRPTDAEYAALVAPLGHRFPEKAFVEVPDGSASVRLPLVLGNPTGACELPAGQRPSPAWDEAIAVVFSRSDGGPALIEQIVADCLLWPPRPTWNAWTSRWPALTDQVYRVMRKKHGGDIAMVEDLAFSEEPPAELAKYPRARCKRLRPHGGEFTAIIDAPTPATWRLFVDAMAKPGAERYQLVREMAQASVPVLTTAVGLPFSVEDLFARWPGLAPLVVQELSRLAGLGGEIAVGEW